MTKLRCSFKSVSAGSFEWKKQNKQKQNNTTTNPAKQKSSLRIYRSHKLDKNNTVTEALSLFLLLNDSQLVLLTLDLYPLFITLKMTEHYIFDSNKITWFQNVHFKVQHSMELIALHNDSLPMRNAEVIRSMNKRKRQLKLRWKSDWRRNTQA